MRGMAGVWLGVAGLAVVALQCSGSTSPSQGADGSVDATPDDGGSGGSGGGSGGSSSSSGSTSGVGGSSGSSSGAQDGGPVPCGSTSCPSGDRCCDHCTGSCVNALSRVNCPDDGNPTHACTDGGGGTCAQSGGSCAGASCCGALQCCSGNPIPPGQAICYAGGCPLSDRNAKAGFTPVQADAVLDGVLSLPLSRWHYKSEPPEVQHIGPMAQDFKAAFGVGADDKHIFQIDADGVSLAAIQALSHKLETVAAAQRTLEHANADLLAHVQQLEAQVETARAAGCRTQ